MAYHDEETLSGGLVAGVAIAPVFFGWLVMRGRYHPLLKIGVAIWMVVSLLPVWLLFSIL